MRTHENIVYLERHGTPLALDLFLPDGPATGTVIHAHGGGFFKGGRKGERTTRLAEKLTGEGLAMAAVSYRLGTPMQALDAPTRRAVKFNRQRTQEAGISIANRLTGSAFEAARQDIGTAMKYIKNNTERFDIKQNKTAIMGISAGGIAGLALAYPSQNLPVCPRPDAVIALGAALMQPWALSHDGPHGMLIHSHYDRVISPDNTPLAKQAAEQANAPLLVLTCARKGHNAPTQALLEDDAPDGTPYWSFMLDIFRQAELLSPSPAGA
ncbi:alpha/beta hydrolase fold domain-containing protein [Shimia haliotis]|uniref:Alpha/beta hydrolase family protein n=1 Tax=Shimia haliotis TaxID=1280847 RepID=A0A1I4B561_9RHOB|nr:alpha/beta hydrolase fold domain-containing protein [Shimia haliotis]SFK63683.1 Alpha/beta hydrolase family protein [Shimia haliotis]